MTVERMPSVVGAVLGNYRITGALGAGGMGAVFTAKHVETNRPAAIKILRKELTGNEELVQRFFNEARASTRIRHPGIIEVFDFGYSTDGLAYLAMELLEGVTLRQRIAQQGMLAQDEAIAIARAIADALGAAHAAGIIHRDLKPENIFVVDHTAPPFGGAADRGQAPIVVGSQLKILDFGVAKLLDRDDSEASRTRTGSLMGTPVYMAPEQARAAGSIDLRADLYSLGCILYEMVSGRPPFTGNVGELLAAHMFNEPPRIEAISPWLDALIGKLLAKEPGDRPRDAAAVIAALSAPPRSFHEAPPEILEAKRSAMPIIAAVATIAIAAAALFFVFGRGGGSDDPAPIAPPPVKIVEPAPPPPAPPVVKAIVTPLPPPVVVVVKKSPPPKPHVQHAPPVADTSGPVTMPTRAPDQQPVTSPEPLVTPKGAPLSPQP